MKNHAKSLIKTNGKIVTKLSKLMEQEKRVCK